MLDLYASYVCILVHIMGARTLDLCVFVRVCSF